MEIIKIDSEDYFLTFQWNLLLLIFKYLAFEFAI